MTVSFQPVNFKSVQVENKPFEPTRTSFAISDATQESRGDVFTVAFNAPDKKKELKSPEDTKKDYNDLLRKFGSGEIKDVESLELLDVYMSKVSESYSRKAVRDALAETTEQPKVRFVLMKKINESFIPALSEIKTNMDKAIISLIQKGDANSMKLAQELMHRSNNYNGVIEAFTEAKNYKTLDEVNKDITAKIADTFQKRNKATREISALQKQFESEKDPNKQDAIGVQIHNSSLNLHKLKGKLEGYKSVALIFGIKVLELNINPEKKMAPPPLNKDLEA